jgi:GMP synthase (glutamine-hydrolysing)
MDCKRFIDEQVAAIAEAAGQDKVISALSGGVDSSVVTTLAYRALGDQLLVYFIDSGLMRRGEGDQVVETFAKLGITVRVVDARQHFLDALRGLTDPEQKRQAVTDTFYRQVFGQLVREAGAKALLHGTILTDVDETVAGIKRQHNILKQIGIDPEKEFGYRVLEPLVTLRKDGVREVAWGLGLPMSIAERMPFPGPGLATRIVGEVTEERLDTVRQATAIIEEELASTTAFQYFAVLMNDRATGIVDNKRRFGQIIVVRCVDSLDAREAYVSTISGIALSRIVERITTEVPDVSRVLFDLTSKPPATIEFI